VLAFIVQLDELDIRYACVFLNILIEMGKKHITMTKIKKDVSTQKLRKLHQKNDIREMNWNICFTRNNFCPYLSEMRKPFGWCTENGVVKRQIRKISKFL
jgi:hypothetical protein